MLHHKSHKALVAKATNFLSTYDGHEILTDEREIMMKFCRGLPQTVPVVWGIMAFLEALTAIYDLVTAEAVGEDPAASEVQNVLDLTL